LHTGCPIREKFKEHQSTYACTDIDINQSITHWERFEELESAPVLVVVVQEELKLAAVLVLMVPVQSWVLPVLQLVPGQQIAFFFEEMKVVGCLVHAVVV
jgi:predicted nucleotidyltransferase